MVPQIPIGMGFGSGVGFVLELGAAEVDAAMLDYALTTRTCQACLHVLLSSSRGNFSLNSETRSRESLEPP